MKKLAIASAAALLATSLPAQAGPHGHGRYYGPPVEHHHHHLHRAAPLAWLLGGIALGSALVAIMPPRPVVAAPAVVVAPPPPLPPRTAWFCQSYQAYYPNVPYCPEGWQPVTVY
ncbi:hypothetical protein [Sulfuricystis multivorans]|uniref:hypothetical protein n=1 Tax=Sulfuricystis multivorans TaxID=2211108 RepID=UPI000F83F28C|nr:hypothetical protein [Sulfuricystis multivorans]